MKLASYKDGSRDGQLVVVSRDLSQAHYATHIANRLQPVLDDWNYLAPQLQDLYDALNNGRARQAFAFDAQQCLAPLPRAYQWVEGDAYLHDRTRALLRQGAGDALWGACDPIVCASADAGIDFAAGLAVVTGDLPLGCAADRALDGIRLVVLANTVHLRTRVAPDSPEALCGVQCQPGVAFSPVAVTTDELGDAWSKGRLQLPLHCSWNGRKVGRCDAGTDMSHHFGQLLAHLCASRAVRAGCIVGTGAVRNQDAAKGYSSIADKRALEVAQGGQPTTPFMQYGDTIRVEMKGPSGQSLFCAIEQEVVGTACVKP